MATTKPRDMVMHRKIFSLGRMSRFQVMIQGKAAKMKSMIMLTSGDEMRCVSDSDDGKLACAGMNGTYNCRLL